LTVLITFILLLSYIVQVAFWQLILNEDDDDDDDDDVFIHADINLERFPVAGMTVKAHSNSLAMTIFDKSTRFPITYHMGILYHSVAEYWSKIAIFYTHLSQAPIEDRDAKKVGFFFVI